MKNKHTETGGDGSVDTVDSMHPQKADVESKAKWNFLQTNFYSYQLRLVKEGI